jgi:glycosyltransferase involved in cell wall biosynthesis
MDATGLFLIVTARNEADRLAATLEALAQAFPSAPVWVADDGSIDDTPRIARAMGARVARSERRIGKGGAATLAARDALASLGADVGAVALLCDGDLGESAARLGPLVGLVRRGEADLAVAAFALRVGGGLGLARGFARWAIRRGCGLELAAPLSGQRALRAEGLEAVLPFARGFGMEVGMTIDAARLGWSVREVELDLEHRATDRTPSGFAHRARQLLDCALAYLARRQYSPGTSRAVRRE